MFKGCITGDGTKNYCQDTAFLLDSVPVKVDLREVKGLSEKHFKEEDCGKEIKAERVKNYGHLFIG